MSLGTTAIFKRCVDALKNHKSFAEGTLDEYCNSFASNLERFRLSKVDGGSDDAIMRNIQEFLPHRNEAIQLFIAIAQYSPNREYIQRMHRFFESLIPYMNRLTNISQLNGADNFKFIIHELFLYALAILLKYDRLDQASYLLEQQYYLPGNSDYGRDAMVSFIVFREYMRCLEHRNKRLGLFRLSIRADLLSERCKGTGDLFSSSLASRFRCIYAGRGCRKKR